MDVNAREVAVLVAVSMQHHDICMRLPNEHAKSGHTGYIASACDDAVRRYRLVSCICKTEMSTKYFVCLSLLYRKKYIKLKFNPYLQKSMILMKNIKHALQEL